MCQMARNVSLGSRLRANISPGWLALKAKPEKARVWLLHLSIVAETLRPFHLACHKTSDDMAAWQIQM